MNSSIPHHFLGSEDPFNPISATMFANKARNLIKDILNRGKWPIIEGGSPFYIS
jgi:tRNA dimethylallyltransferase